MENTVRNSSDFVYLSRFSGPAMLFNSTMCRNQTDGNNTSRCEPDHAATGNFDGGDTTPVIIAIVITALYSIVCVVGLVGNVLVMYVIIR